MELTDMTISQAFTSSATIGGTERFCASDSTSKTDQTDDGVYQLFLDLSALAAGDIFRIRVYEKVISGGTSRVVMEENVPGPVGAPHYVTPTLILLHGWEFSLFKVAGTDRSIAWSIRKVV
jgi:hypothetical protein